MFIKSGLAQICAFVAFMLLYATTTNAFSYVHKNNEKINDDILDIHMLPHAHCDTGWLETVQGYYDSYVHSILNTVVSSLYADKKLRFIWSEIKWLEMWWNNATEIQKKQLKFIVSTGQLEFVGAGWSQNDEVTTTWYDVIDNVNYGTEYLRKIGLQDLCPQNGRCVRVGWQIDMFAGYSGVTPSLWAMMGFDAMYMRWAGTSKMFKEWTDVKGFEFIWEGSSTKNIASDASRGASNRIFAHIMKHNYGDMSGYIDPKTGLRLDWDDPNFKKIPVNKDNVEAYAKLVVEFARNRTDIYQGPILTVWGSDFEFHQAQFMFGNMSLIHDEINANPQKYGAKIKYTTLGEYTDFIHATDLKFKLRTFPQDFEYGWPHVIPQYLTGNDTVQYQTGAPISHASYKQKARLTSSKHRSAEAILSTASVSNQIDHNAAKTMVKALEKAWDGIGIVQHHDSMPGTMSAEGMYTTWGTSDLNSTKLQSSICKTANCMVLEDYTHMLEEAEDVSVMVLNTVAGDTLLEKIPSGHKQRVRKNDDSVDIFTKNIAVYNSLAHTRITTVSLPQDLFVYAKDKNIVVYDFDTKQPIQEVQFSKDGRSLSFLAKINGLSIKQFTVEVSTVDTTHAVRGNKHKQDVTAKPPVIIKSKEDPSPIPSISNANFKLTFDNDGLLESVTELSNGLVTKVQNTYGEYHTTQGGPYVMIETESSFDIRPPKSTEVSQGTLYTEVVQHFEDYSKINGGGELFQIIRLYHDVDVEKNQIVEVVHQLPPINPNTEIISKVTTDFKTGQTFYSADSGMEMHERVIYPTLPISGNYHAMVMQSLLKDSKTNRALAISCKHTMGVASFKDGQLEYMMMRRIENGTDDQGPWPLKEVTALTIPTWMTFGTFDEVDLTRMNHALHLQYPLDVITAPISAISKFNVSVEWPEQIHLLSFNIRDQPNDDNRLEYVVRVQNMHEGGAVVKNLNIRDLFPEGKTNVICSEMTLNLQEKRSDNDRVRYRWAVDNVREANKKFQPTNNIDNSCLIDVGPMDIRTFVVTI